MEGRNKTLLIVHNLLLLLNDVLLLKLKCSKLRLSLKLEINNLKLKLEISKLRLKLTLLLRKRSNIS